MNRLLVTLILVLVLVASFVTMAKAHAATQTGSVPLVQEPTSSDTTTQRPSTGRARRGGQARGSSTPQPPTDLAQTSAPIVQKLDPIEFTSSDNKSYDLRVTFDPGTGEASGVEFERGCDHCPTGIAITQKKVAYDDLQTVAKDMIAKLGGKVAGQEPVQLTEKEQEKANKAKERAEKRAMLCLNPDPKVKEPAMSKKDRATCLFNHYDENASADSDDSDENKDKIIAELVKIYKPLRVAGKIKTDSDEHDSNGLLGVLDDAGVAGKRVIALIDADIARDVETADRAAFQQATLALQQAIALNNLPMYQAAENQLVALQRNGTAITAAQTQLVKSANAYINAANQEEGSISKSDIDNFKQLAATTQRDAAITAMEQSIAKRTNNKVNTTTAIASSNDPYVNMAAFANASATASTSASNTLDLGTPKALEAWVRRDTDNCDGQPCDPRAPKLGWGAWNPTNGQPTLTLGSTTGTLRTVIPAPLNTGATGLLNANLNTSNGIIQIPTLNTVSSTAGTLNPNTNVMTFRGTGGNRGG